MFIKGIPRSGRLHLTSVMLAVRQSLMIVRPYRYMEEA
jgi:hypothetical protein